MRNNLIGKDIIRLQDMTPGEFRYLLDLSHQLKAEKLAGVDQRRFVGKNVIAQFEWESTRTRCSFETASHDLGLGFTYLSNSHFGKKETVKDSVRVFSEIYDAIVIRSQSDDEYLFEIARNADIPVINAMTGGNHPTQMLADAMTLEESWGGPGSLRGKKFAFVGDAAGSALIYGPMCALVGLDFYVVCPDDPRYQLCDDFKNQIQEMYDKWAPDSKFVITHDLNDLEGMDALATECWLWQNPEISDAMFQDWSNLEYNLEYWVCGADVLMPYRLSSELMETYVKNPNCLVLHMLPAYHNGDMKLMEGFLKEAKNDVERELITNGFCITDELFEKHAEEIFREAGNRQPTIKACLAAVLGL